MKNTQRKKLKMRVSFIEGYYKPPYPYTLKVRGIPDYTQPIKAVTSKYMPDAVCVKDMVTPTPYPGMKQKPVFVQPNTTAFTQRKLIGFNHGRQRSNC